MKEFKLDNEPKITSGFKVPEGYFENVESQVLDRIAKKEVPVFTLFVKKNWWIAAAAVLVIALSIPIANKMQATANTIDSNQLENYLSQQTNLNEDDIVELMDEEKIQQIKLDLNVDKNELEETLIANPNIEEYIIN